MLSNRTLYSNGKRCRYRGYSKKGRKGKRRKKEKRGSWIRIRNRQRLVGSRNGGRMINTIIIRMSS